ncbi:MAG: GTPase Era [Deltaproteobacteria bacterium]|nr:GTPase Era [Deltaproteobacteria bacterium]
MSFKSGFIAIVGRPNVGKSTLLNAVLGEKVSIVSSKPQTTRTRIRGIKNMENGQLVFMDTPGVHAKKGLLNAFMLKEALSSMTEVDAVLLVVEAGLPPAEDERFVLENLKAGTIPVILAINKVDAVDKRQLLPLIDGYSKLFGFSRIIPVSALKKDGIEILLNSLLDVLPEGPGYFPPDMHTDQFERFMAGEFIREKVFELMRDEIPYSSAVVIEEFKERPKKNLISIKAVINVEKDSQKGIIIGKGGAMLKKIGTQARQELERVFGAKVYLELFVRVARDWTKDKQALKGFGYSH